jgi:NIPSNAP
MSCVYEMRMYYAAPGRMDALVARFANYTEPLFARYGIKTIGYWLPRENANNLLLYIVEHESVESAAKNWEAFRNDPDWLRIKAETDGSVPLAARIESYFMDKVDFSKFETQA